MELYDIIDLINDNSILMIYNEKHDLIAMYDGKESIPDVMNYRLINDIFPDAYNGISAIGIELSI